MKLYKSKELDKCNINDTIQLKREEIENLITKLITPWETPLYLR